MTDDIMSVLIEAISLVVPRFFLDGLYPGGTSAFLDELERPSSETRYTCSDDHLISTSFLDTAAADRAAMSLHRAGLIEAEDDSFRHFAVVDQLHGPTMPCTWLMWSRDPAGFTSAWITGADPGKLAVPDGWTVEQSRRLKRSDIGGLGRTLKLSDENGVETWLDFESGRIITGFVQRFTP